MQVKTVKEMQTLDNWAINSLGIPCFSLMENAGNKVADFIIKDLKAKQATILAYKGNNSGDGFVCARHLICAGINVKIYLFCKVADLKNEPRHYLDILIKMGVPIIEIHNEKELKNALEQLSFGEVVVDAIFGLGFKGEFIGFPAKLIDYINQNSFIRVAVDIPSGINADSGAASKHSFNAHYTITFSYPKAGLLRYPAIEKVGKLIIVDIGIPDKHTKHSLKKKQTEKTDILDLAFAKNSLKIRPNVSHKGNYGKILIIAGSKNMSGAAILSARAALKAGAGVVHLAIPENMQKFIAPLIPEVITHGLYETSQGSISSKALNQIIEISKNMDAIVLGPGITTNTKTKDLVVNLLSFFKKHKSNIPLVIDADALNIIAENKIRLNMLKNPIILTPHLGEMSKLVNKKVAFINKQREKHAIQLSKKQKSIVILKGAYSIITNGKLQFLNPTGNAGMATAGSGDVLSGIIGALIGQQIPVFEAAKLGVFIHGLSGDVANKIQGEDGLIASDIINAIPLIIKSIKE